MSFLCSSSIFFTQSGSKKGFGLKPMTIVTVLGEIACRTSGMLFVPLGFLAFPCAKSYSGVAKIQNSPLLYSVSLKFCARSIR
jgi:hypothetical protein